MPDYEKKIKAIIIDDEEYFCFTYGDGVGDINITELVAFHKAQNVKATLTATIPPASWPRALVVAGVTAVSVSWVT